MLTGFGITDIKLARKVFVWPLQKVRRFNITPLNYTLSLSAMTSEKLEFTLPAVFTIGPRDEKEALIKYARLLANTASIDNMNELVTGIIEGETRVIAAGLLMEEIFKERKFFKEQVIKTVQAELDQFGLRIYNANVKQLMDTPGSEYFTYLRLKSHEGAINQAKVDVAEAKYKGDVGEKKRLGLTRQEVAKIEADTLIFENTKAIDIGKAQSELSTKQSEFNKNIEIANIEAKKAATIRESELQKIVEVERALVNTERLRAETIAKAKVDAESSNALADAEFYKSQREADAKLYNETQAALGVKAVYQAQASGLKRLATSFGGKGEAMVSYLMLEQNLFEKLAQSNADAIKGLKPKVTVWKDCGNGETASNPIHDIFGSLPPLLDGIHAQTGVKAQNF